MSDLIIDTLFEWILYNFQREYRPLDSLSLSIVPGMNSWAK